MDRVINIKVGGNYISKDNKNAGVTGEGNVTTLRITFDEGWKHYAKTVTFWDARGQNPVKRIQGIDLIEDITKDTLTYITPIPPEPLAIAGEMTFVIDGFYGEFVESENGDYEIAYADKSKRQRSISDKLVVKESPMTDSAGEPTDPTPTQAEQLQQQIDKFIDDVQVAVIARNETKVYRDEAVQSASQSANDAATAAEKAEEAKESATKANNAVGKTSYIGDNGNWYAWDSSKGVFYDTGVKAQSGSTVYYGDNPPPEADVWIDPEGESSIDEIKKYIDEQTEIIKSDVEGLQAQINEEAHFRGYVSTNAKIQALNATPNDFAYSAESGTKWVYEAENGWVDTGKPVPDQLTPASDTTPLINGEASVGSENAYARGDHRHPTDTTRASVEEVNDLQNYFDNLEQDVRTCQGDISALYDDTNALREDMGDIDTALDNIIAIQNSLIGGES